MPDVAQGMAADLIVGDQAVGGDAALFHGAPQCIVVIHGSPPFAFVSPVLIIMAESHGEHIAQSELT